MGKVTIAVILFVAELFTAASAQAEGQHSLIDYVLKTRTIADPDVVTYCFNTYLPVFSQVNTNFMEAHQKCSSDAMERASKLEEAALTSRRQIEMAGDGICVDVKACDDLQDSLDFFKCYSAQSNNATRVIYELTHNSSNIAKDIREQYLISEAEKYKCQNATHRVHVEDTAKTYKDLDICLRGGGGGGSSTETPSTSTEAPQTTDATTATDDPASTTTESPGTLPPYEPDDPNDPREYKFDRNLKILPQLRKFY